ncbi:MAG: hypothetical protein DRO98_04900 [Archaeoglobales archaeon]|nr:MAG: hypothetical protein DRO98_04900 [Archaeoglobales archaeon]
MIKKLKLINFRGVKEGELELGDLTILVGSNNSAKTTILEALFLAPNPLRFVPYMPQRVDLTSPHAHTQALTAASLIHEMHKTLNSDGYAFLLYKYVAEEAAIQWDDVELRFVKHGNNIFLVSNKEIFSGYFTLNTPKIKSFGWLGLSSAGLKAANEQNREKLLSQNPC